MKFRYLMLAMAALASPVAAQTPIDARVGKLEKEMKAVQRNVFKTGVPVEPDIAPAATTEVVGTPASTPIADLTVRVDTLEKQLAALTGADEQSGFRIKQLEDALKALDARMKLVEGGAVASAASTAPAAEEAPAAATSTSGAGRAAAFAAVAVPTTGNAVEDAYSYGYRLYAAKLYPEAQARLKAFVAKNPKHARASYAQNLLGRAYFDEGKPALASVAFYDNYQKMPKGERASESLYWLGQSLTQLKKLPEACKVYDELGEVYGTSLTADLVAKMKKGRADASCAA